MTSSLLVQRLTDDDLWARVAGQARCAGSGLDPDQWYPVSTESAQARHEAAAAIAVCASCPVRAQCLELSLRHWDIGQHGVWGGLVATDRADLRRRRARRPSRTPPGRPAQHDRATAVPPGAAGPGAGRGRTASADARPRGPATRGRLRIYLGYAPGAGTTCALLNEGRRRAEHGTDVVVASAETRGRTHTEDLLAGLEVIPSAKVPYRGTPAAEMDLGAVLARGPALALVDDFARRNPPGTRHAARWQDVEELLAAGIDVISTISVGHLDSLADVVAEITGTAPRQTVPDSVVRAAGEVELVDVAPDALRDRLARGHLYPADQMEAALGGWFQMGNLSALREIALLWLASTLAGGRGHLPGGGEPGRCQTRERVVVALSGRPEGETLIRRAARIAARSGGDLMAVHAAQPGRPAASVRALLAAQRRLVESAGGTYHQLADADIPTALLAFAHAHNATQLVLGATPRTWLAALRPAASIRSRVIRRGGGLDVHVVTCTSGANGVLAPTGDPPQKDNSNETANASWPGRVRQAPRWGPQRAAFGEGRHPGRSSWPG
jgi:K+-sensing histidine kinase KdpD